jgi:hypothetical protein
MISAKRRKQGGQVMVIVAVALLALIGSAALVLLAGSAEWQKNQLQQLADQAALDSALQIGVGCDAGKATTVITEADVFLASQRARTGSLSALAGTCATQYQATDTFGSLSATYHYPYRAHQQQVEVILTLTLPISFGGEVGRNSTTVTRRAVAQSLAASVPAVSATTLSCTGGQVNVAGSVAAQNAIALSGGCALYSHTRFDAASGTYSDLGNVSVYTDGQTWVGGAGLCTPAANAGSTNAICADGAELSGHVTPACGTSGTSAFLSLSGAAINPNPCAAGVALPPVAPVSTALPPEPNTDPAAIASLQGTGGAACAPGGAYPAIVAGGTTWGTGLAPAPIKDAGGYYHFKPSCYGYLDLGSLAGGGITNRQIGVESARQTHNIKGDLPVASVAGTMLVATVNTDDTTVRFVAPAGWQSAAEIDTAPDRRVEIWYYPNNPGGIPSATFTVNPATVSGEVQLSEWNGVATVAPLDQTGTQSITVATPTAVLTTSGAMAQARELVITNTGYLIGGGETYSGQAGWTPMVNDPTNGYGSEYRLDLPAAVASETVTTSKPSTWANVIASFKAAGGPGSAAVLDPGFYYFNGSGFAGGGGICLNGGRLMARDVTLEFVNQTGFSSGTCAPGGGASGCTGSCAFGSTPCSISACPPNTAFDPASGGGYTWFAAPCATVPAGDASCPGSWCPVGDRACWNLLVWAPSSNTGQFAITGTSASAWLLGSTFWPGTCTYAVNGKSSIAGTIACGSLSMSAGVGAATAVGSDSGINTALVEAVLIE